MSHEICNLNTHELQTRIDMLEGAIRKHRDQHGDDRCWMDDEELYRVLPEGYMPPVRDSSVELKMCERFIACRHNPATKYLSPQRRIEELEKLLADNGIKEGMKEILPGLYEVNMPCLDITPKDKLD